MMEHATDLPAFSALDQKNLAIGVAATPCPTNRREPNPRRPDAATNRLERLVK